MKKPNNFFSRYKKIKISLLVTCILVLSPLVLLIFGGEAVMDLGYIYQFEMMPIGTVIGMSLLYGDVVDNLAYNTCIKELMGGEWKTQTQEDYDAEVEERKKIRDEQLEWIEDLMKSDLSNSDVDLNDLEQWKIDTPDLDLNDLEQWKIDVHEDYNMFIQYGLKPGEKYHEQSDLFPQGHKNVSEKYLHCPDSVRLFFEFLIMAILSFFNIFVILFLVLFVGEKITKK